MLTVRCFEAADAERWNAFNAQARNGHLLFDRGFMDYHADRFTDASLLFLDGDAVVGILPANCAGDRIHSHQGLTFGGLVLAEARLPAAMEMLDRAVSAWRDRGAAGLRYKPLPSFYAARPSQEDLYWLVQRGARLVRRDVSTTIALCRRGQVSERRRRGARKAQRAGLTFAWSDDWAEGWELVTTVLAERHQVRPVHGVAEITLLAGRFPRAVRLYVARGAGGPLAIIVLFVSGAVWHAQYIAASPDGRASGALDGMFLDLINQAAEAGAAFFDFGISTEDDGRWLNTGLITQKEEFGGSATTYDSYELDF
jgi:hypothetical protein